ncbi:ThuA domain-containing protein [Streptomyces violaceorubidus]
MSADSTSGAAGLRVTFTGSAKDADSPDLTYSWDFGDGTKGEGLTPTHQYKKVGTYSATFTAKDPEGNTGHASVRIVVGNTEPKVTIETPGNGTLLPMGEPIPFKVKVTDPEETIDCSKVKVAYSLGHDSHAHELTSEMGCEGTSTRRRATAATTPTPTSTASSAPATPTAGPTARRP